MPGHLIIRWCDLDFDHKIMVGTSEVQARPFIWVRRTYRRGKFTAPKNGKTRKVDMSSQLKTALEEHLINERHTVGGKGHSVASDLVFHRKGKVIEQNYIRRVFKRVLKKAKLPDMKFHSLRHTYASLLLSKGESPVYVKEQLGHHSIQITVDIYGKWIQTAGEVGVNRLDDET